MKQMLCIITLWLTLLPTTTIAAPPVEDENTIPNSDRIELVKELTKGTTMNKGIVYATALSSPRDMLKVNDALFPAGSLAEDSVSKAERTTASKTKQTQTCKCNWCGGPDPHGMDFCAATLKNGSTCSNYKVECSACHRCDSFWGF
jgi:hypothetical protein